MGQLNTNLTLEGFDDPALGIVAIGDIKGESLDVSALEPYYNQRLTSQATYNSASNELVLTVPTGRTSITLQVKMNTISSGLKQQLVSLTDGANVTLILNSRSSSLVGMHIEPVVQ